MPTFTVEVSKIQDLERRLSSSKNDAEKVKLLCEIASFYAFTNFREAQHYLSELDKYLKKTPNRDYEYVFHVLTALVENQVYNHKLSEHHFQRAVEIAESEGTFTQQIELYIDYMGTLINLANKKATTDYIEKAKRLLKMYPNDIFNARLLCRIGHVQWMYHDYDLATESFFQSEKLFSEQNEADLTVKDRYFLSLVYNGLGLAYEKTNDHDRSVGAYLKVVEICETHDIRSRLAWHYLNVGRLFMAKEEYRNAEKYFQKVNLINDDISLNARAYATANLGYCYYMAARYEEALELYNHAEVIYKRRNDDFANLAKVASWKSLVYKALNNLEKAEWHLYEAFEMANEAKTPEIQANVCRSIAELMAQKGEFKKAYNYERLYSDFQQKNYEESNRIKIDELEFKYEAERRRKETELLRLQATELQLKALRAQMNPHFMFNALNSIQNYINSDNRDFAEKYLAKFALLMRMSLEYSELEVISLEKEIQFLENYLIINQKLRFEDRLRFKIDIDEEIEEDIIGVPTMIVQPYIENAIEHGLRPKRGGLIKIEFTLEDENTIICVIDDDGIGRKRAREMQEKDGYHQRHKSRGTSITEKRLELLQNNNKKNRVFVNTIDKIDPLSNISLGTRVEIKIPFFELPLNK